MRLEDFPLLTDESIDPEVVAHLRNVGFDVLDVKEQGFTIETVRTVMIEEIDLQPPFILVAERTGSHVGIRVRRC